MNSRIHLFACVACTLLLPLKVMAGVCDAHFTFDGNLNDSGSNGYDGQMIGQKGVIAAPQFVDGKYGRALQLDGTSAMRSFVDLHFDTCPEVTVTAWIQVNDGVRKGVQELISTGSGSGPGIRVSGANLLLKGSANGIIRRDAIRPNAGWMFVAGVYDYTNGIYTLYSRNRGVDKEMGTSRKPPDEAIWVGAFNDGLANAATNILIDDVRIYGRLFSTDELRAIQTNAAVDPDVGTQVATSGPACAISSDCAPGNYCALDNTCHPESHAPKQSLEFDVIDAGGDGQTLDEINAQLAERNSGAGGTLGNLEGATAPLEIGYESEEAALAAQREREAASQVQQDQDPEAQAEMAAQQNELEQQRRDEAAAARSVQEENSPPSGTQNGGIQAGTGTMSVREALDRMSFDREPSGDVRDCTSFAEITAEIAANTRDEIVRFAAAASCQLLTAPVHATNAAIGVADLAGYETDEFREKLLKETFGRCIDGATAVSKLPDAGVRFWNTKIARNSWATIGPRMLRFGETQSGNLISPGDRKYLSSMPWLGDGNAFLLLKELDGRARVTARVCTVNMFNRYSRIKLFSLNATPQERENQSQIIGWDLGDIHMTHLIVYLDGAGRLGRNFKYELGVE